MDVNQMVWTRPPKAYSISDTEICITTEPGTDLWQRTYYGFQNDNAQVLQLRTAEKLVSTEKPTKLTRAKLTNSIMI